MTERERFEVWAETHCTSIDRWRKNLNHYDDNRTELAWEAWQAAVTEKPAQPESAK